eukprot:CAMPEP_0179025500 /NCGR_PEP_ID=MMETSP0796-20121207/8018_1 /TAXON_ID=73915 /ORGANISM="Pyrodinium bahamense, Strain pbaha01" /LENGTH=90 /DNA_ID=CAMNT_0020721525 /DNA_START=232 /DNA_END=501 /DNA_ORIENTATION=-
MRLPGITSGCVPCPMPRRAKHSAAPSSTPEGNAPRATASSLCPPKTARTSWHSSKASPGLRGRRATVPEKRTPSAAPPPPARAPCASIAV